MKVKRFSVYFIRYTQTIPSYTHLIHKYPPISLFVYPQLADILETLLLPLVALAL